MNRIVLLLSLAAALLPTAPHALAQPKPTIAYQGYLEEDGTPLNDPSATLTFRLFNTANGGSALWTETKNDVAITDGVFNVPLGNQTLMPNTLFDGLLYLSVAVGGTSAPQLSPRTVFRSVPYARTLSSPARVTGAALNNEAVLRIENTASVGYGLYVTTPSLYGVWGESSNPSAYAVYGNATSATGLADGVFGRTASTAGRGVYGEALATSGTAYGVYGKAASPNGRGVFGWATSTTGLAYGVRGESASTTGHGVSGNATAATGTSYGVYGRSASTDGSGVYGVATSTTGFAAYGVFGESASTSGRGVRGEVTATTGTNYGVFGESQSSSGRGVYGVARAATGTNYGVQGAALGTTGVGVWGEGSNGTGVNYGGYFRTLSPSGYGLYAENFSSSGYAARFADPTRFDANMEFYDGSDLRILLDPDEGGEAPSFKLRRNGVNVIELDADHSGDARIFTEELEITGGSDLSEHFDVAPPAGLAAPLPGMVVSIDPAHPGRLAVSGTPYDGLVAGVVSGAGGVETGLMMGQRGSVADGDHPVALVGRVYVLVDASYGPIRPGDLLTTSATPGHAMRAADRARAPGAVLGKAMTGLESGRGLVLVLVSLQ